MAMPVVAAEFTIESPDTPLGWAIVVAIGFTFLWVFVRGFISFFDKVSTDFLGPLFWTVFGILGIIFLYTERPWERENLVEADISVNTGVQGVQTHSHQDPALTDDQLHENPIDSHLYDDGHDHEDFGN